MEQLEVMKAAKPRYSAPTQADMFQQAENPPPF